MVPQMAPFVLPANRCERCLMLSSSQQRRGVYCGASPKVPRVAQTVARKVLVQPDSDFANTPNRRYIFPTGDPFPLGPLFYRKTISKQVCALSCVMVEALCGQIVLLCCTHTVFLSTTNRIDRILQSCRTFFLGSMRLCASYVVFHKCHSHLSPAEIQFCAPFPALCSPASITDPKVQINTSELCTAHQGGDVVL